MNTHFYNGFIIDDDDHSKQIIHHLLGESFPEINIIGQAGTVADAINLLSETVPDIIFLDAELPDGSGFDILRQYPSLSAQVILISGFDHYAIKAIKASVIDYVLKPVNEKEFGEAVQKALARCKDKGNRMNDFSELLNRFHNQMIVRKLKVPTLYGFILADIDDIIRCEATDNYTVLFFNKEAPKTVSRTLATYEEELKDYGFIRIHHKHLINIRQVAEYNKGKSGGGYVVMKDKVMLEVSVRKKDQLLHAFHSRKHTF
ncbi:MAG: LytTR family DNA-binding domain-containing protein [Taibaiella sp.]|jgi:two-component system LytT family response regulator